MKKRFVFFFIWGIIITACSELDIANGDYEGSGYMLGEIKNSSDYDAKIEFSWQYDKNMDSLLIDVPKEGSVDLKESNTNLVKIFIEDFYLAHPKGAYEVFITFMSSPPRCISFTGNIEKGTKDIRSLYNSEEIEQPVDGGTIWKRYTLESALYKSSNECP